MSSGPNSGQLMPTFEGFVQNSMDGLMLFEGCLSGKLHHVPRRPHDRERSNLIKSGSIFIYEENASGIKRWTDGVAWSPSRILGNFLIYRELEKPFPPGEKKRAMKRKRSSQLDDSISKRESEEQEPETKADPSRTPPQVSAEIAPESATGTPQDSERELDRQLIGSLVDSYGFRDNGLVKKTMSIAVNGVSHHLVSYYKVEDVKNGLLRRPNDDARLANLAIRPELYMKQNFRTPVEDTEQYVIDPTNNKAYAGNYMPGGYNMPAGQYVNTPGYNTYGVNQPPAGAYSSPAQGWGPQGAAMGPSYGPPPGYSYPDYYNRPANGNGRPDGGSAPGPGSYGSYAAPGPYQNSAAPVRTGGDSYNGQYQSPMRTGPGQFPPSGTPQQYNGTPTTGQSQQPPAYSGPTQGQGQAQSYSSANGTSSYGQTPSAQPPSYSAPNNGTSAYNAPPAAQNSYAPAPSTTSYTTPAAPGGPGGPGGPSYPSSYSTPASQPGYGAPGMPQQNYPPQPFQYRMQ